jgi:hypothetical protein
LVEVTSGTTSTFDTAVSGSWICNNGDLFSSTWLGIPTERSDEIDEINIWYANVANEKRGEYRITNPRTYKDIDGTDI